MELRERQREAIYGGEFGPGILKCWDENYSGPDATGTEIVGGQSTLVVAATGFGKCLAPGTPVLMYSGEIKKVEDIQCGDLLMGPDSKPRCVVSLAHGREEMFQITPSKGDAYVVNRSHILSLRMTGGAHIPFAKNEIINMGIEEYLSRNNTFKHCAKGWRVGVEFFQQEVPIDPYFLGLWLGDGHSNKPSITTGDLEIKNYLLEFAYGLDLRVRIEANSENSEVFHLLHTTGNTNGSHRPNELKASLHRLRLLNNKHIPLIYKANAKSYRLELLAGIIDSDGHYASRGAYEITLKSKRLTDDVLWLARSLGLAAYTKQCQKTCCNNGIEATYFRTIISGDIDLIPCKITRKKARPRKQKKNVLNVGIQVESVGTGEYFGFQIEGDGLFLLGDFTVTHNTVLFAAVADLHLQERSGRVMLLTHRDKLLWQAQSTFEQFGRLCDVEMGEFHADQSQMFGREIVLMTVQTGRSGKGQKRYEKFNPEDFGLVIVDECHHAPSNEFLNCINHFKQNPDCKILGVTATPDRHDEKALRTVFGSVAYAYGLQRAIGDGWLCPIEVQFHELEGFDISDVGTVAGDLAQGKLENEMLKQVAAMASEICKVTPHDLGLVFCVGTEQAKALTDALNAIQPSSSAYILGTTPAERRTEIYQSFVPDGIIRRLVTVGVATEGYDNPYVQHIWLGRPTKSRSLFEQMIGRGSRVWPEVDLSGESEDRLERIALSMKPVNSIHDFVGVSGKHKLVTAADILGGDDALNAEVVKRLRKSGVPGDVAEMMRAVSKEYEERERAKQAKLYGQGKATYRVHRIDPFNLFQISDVRQSQIDGCFRLSPRQVGALVRAGYDPATLSSKQGKQLLGGLAERRNSGLATPKQVKLLRDKGVSGAEAIPFSRASQLITAIANNGWRYEPSMMQ